MGSSNCAILDVLKKIIYPVKNIFDNKIGLFEDAGARLGMCHILSQGDIIFL